MALRLRLDPDSLSKRVGLTFVDNVLPIYPGGLMRKFLRQSLMVLGVLSVPGWALRAQDAGAAAADAAFDAASGPRLAFTSKRTGGGDIYLLNVADGAVRRLTSGSGHEDQPVWSFDGSKLAYRRGGDIWTMNKDGSAQWNRTPATPSNEQFPFWLPDGRLGFTSDRSGSEKLYLLASPDWTPLNLSGRKGQASADGLYVCYTRDLEVYWASLSERVEHNLSQYSGSDHNCAWNPTDSFRVLIHTHRAFEGDRGGRIWEAERSRAVLTPPVTSGTDNSEGDNHPTWHKSGWIAWSRHVGCTPTPSCTQQYDKMEIFARDPAGNVFRYTVNGVEDSEPNFKP